MILEQKGTYVQVIAGSLRERRENTVERPKIDSFYELYTTGPAGEWLGAENNPIKTEIGSTAKIPIVQRAFFVKPRLGSFTQLLEIVFKQAASAI